MKTYLKKKIGPEIRCFNIESNQKRANFGLECNRFLCKPNSSGDANIWIKCPKCGAVYECKDGFQYLKALTKHKKQKESFK